MALTAFPIARRSLLTDAQFTQTQYWLAPLFKHSSKPPELHSAHELFESIVGLVEPALQEHAAFQEVLEFQARWASRDIGKYAEIYQGVRRRQSNLVNTFVSVTYGRALWMIESSEVERKAFLGDAKEIMAEPAAAARRLKASVVSLGDDFLGHALATTEMLAADDEQLAAHLDNVSSLFRRFRPKEASSSHKSKDEASVTALSELGMTHRRGWHFIPAHVALAMAAWK